MQINANYNSNTNFTAKHIIVNKLKKGSCDVYSLSNTDAPFIKRCLNNMNGIKMPYKMKHPIGTTEIKTAFIKILKKALNIEHNSEDRVFVAINQDKEITGMAYIDGSVDKYITTLSAKNSVAENNLLLAGINDAVKSKKQDWLIIENKNLTETSKPFYLRFGFKKDKDMNGRLISIAIADDRLSEVLSKKQGTATILKNNKNYDMSKILNLD